MIYCFAGLLTYSSLLSLPTRVLSSGGWVISRLFNRAYSSGTVQELHLIPFSSVTLNKWLAEQNVANVVIYMIYAKDYSKSKEKYEERPKLSTTGNQPYRLKQ